ncbi:hypothetical protein PNEG_01623 [Pneumocystis murina B123]|uniref:FMP27 GFWDK domain-containing protein n=1 Tax=Pneumocystis murina (strain B123) TaxID=1069680 RepID=M7NSW7_PNEMU|nr:hypothetical protein PNEG_01623 [Pneumocystis murina B123]EMR10372.1 hypothetical protein PNEG_01623 [Pneumocystis murina B123]
MEIFVENILLWIGIFFLNYILLTHILLKVIKKVGGVHIRRFGYFSIHGIELCYKEYANLYVESVRVHFHRPRLATKRWISFSVKEIFINIRKPCKEREEILKKKSSNNFFNKYIQKSIYFVFNIMKSSIIFKIKDWVDIIIIDTSINIEDYGKFFITTFNMHFNNTSYYNTTSGIYTGRFSKLLSREKRFEMINIVDSILFISKRGTSSELIDKILINIQGKLDHIIKNIKFSLKCGKFILPLDEFTNNNDINYFFNNKTDSFISTLNNYFKVKDESKEPIMELKENMVEKMHWFNIIHEIQFHVGNLKIKKSITFSSSKNNSSFLLLRLKEIGINIHHIGKNSSIYRQFFDVPASHQILASCISLSISIFQKTVQEKEADFILIPMITFACKISTLDHLVKSNMVTKGLHITNIIANISITSPSIDLRFERLLSIVSIFESRNVIHTSVFSKLQLLKDFIPKLNFNFSIYEPVIRILLPFNNSLYENSKQRPTILILSLSNIFLDLQTNISGNDISRFFSVNTSILFISQKLYYHTSFKGKYNILTIENFTLHFKFDLSPFNNVSIGIFHENVIFNLNNIEIIYCLNNIFYSISNIRYDYLSEKNIGLLDMFLLYKCSLLLRKIEFHGSKLDIYLFGNEPRITHDHKGILLRLDSWKIEYCFLNMISKELLFSIYKESKSPNFQHILNTFVFNTIPSSRGTLLLNGFKIFAIHAENVLDMKEPIIEVIKYGLTFVTEPNKDHLLQIIIELDQLCLTYSIFKYYTILLALKILEKTFFQENIFKTSQGYHTEDNGQVNNLLWGYIFVYISISSVKVKIELPSKQFLMLNMHKLEISHNKDEFLSCKAGNIVLCVPSPVIQKFWDRIVNINTLTIYYKRIKIDQKNESTIVLYADAIRIRIPHKFVLHSMVESIQNNIKSVKQLYYCFFISSNSSTLTNHPVKAKVIPRIQLESSFISFDMEDDPFEARLGLIWRIGLIEQKARIMRETTFDIKAEKIKDESELINDNEQTKTDNENEYFLGTSFEKSELKQLYNKQDSHIKNVKDVQDFSESKFSNLSSKAEQAYEKLQEYNSHSWIKKFQKVNNLQSFKLYSIRHRHWTLDGIKCISTFQENILPLPTRPPLLSILFSKVEFIFDKPSFPIENLYQFLRDTGKGLPLETKFSVLIPFNFSWKMAEAKICLRDYPLPLIYIPDSNSLRPQNFPTWEFSSDLVIAEQFSEKESIRYVEVCIIPNNSGKEGSSFNIKVARTITPVKIYGVVDVNINTLYPTQITWGMSLQPAIQDIMRIFGTFSRPFEDPSDKLNFWDKIRLIMHTSFKFKWKNDGNVYLTLKGSRDPYLITGDGAGFIKCWKGNVEWSVGCSLDSRNFMVIISDEFLLAIPDFIQQAQSLMNWPNTIISAYDNLTNNTYQKNAIHFQKIIMKLKGGVKWTAGLVFEQHCDDACQNCYGKYQCRIFHFKPHYKIILRIPKFAFSENGQKYDAFKGFRSHYIHGSLSIICPIDVSLPDSKFNEKIKSYNAIHLTPKVFQHFFNWWSLFSGIMSFPLKSGKLFLFPHTKKKINRYLMTFSYKLELSPLFLSHIYNYRTDIDWVDKTFTSIGIKGKTEKFILDVHQKKDLQFKKLHKTRKDEKLIIDNATINFTSTDLKVILSRFNEVDIEDSNKFRYDSQKSHDFRMIFQKNNSNHFIVDEDLKWVDIDDFIDLDLDFSLKSAPVFQILPLAYIPQFIYFRETNNHCNGSGPENICLSKYQFRNGDTHFCILNNKKDPYDIQVELIQKRQNEIMRRISRNKNKLSCIENVISKKSKASILKSQYKKIIDENAMLFDKHNFINAMLLHMKADQDNKLTNEIDMSADNHHISSDVSENFRALSKETISEHFSDFNNRFFVYNIQLKWYNSVRNILLSYIHQITQREGFVYYMSQKAVKFITDLIKEQIKLENSLSMMTNEKIINKQGFNDQEINELIDGLINDTNNDFKDEKNNKKSFSSIDNPFFRDDFDYILSKNYDCQHSYIVKLFAPQIQLQSEKNNQAVAIITAQNMQLKVFSIIDKNMVDDTVSGLLQHRFIVKMNNAQIFVSKKNDFIENSTNFFYTNSYGSLQSNWSPWVPLESIYDFTGTPLAFTRIIDQTSASLGFIKYNHLRLKKNELNHNKNDLFESFKIESPEKYVNNIFVDFPKIIFTANSDQYYIIFLIVTDLLIYTEPAQKEKSKRLEKLMLAVDFSDLTGTAEMVVNLQKRIRNLEEIKTQHRLYYENYNMEQRLLRMKIEAELRDCEDELFYLMKSIAASQKHDGSIIENVANMSWLLSASEVVWHGLLENNKPFVDFGLSNATYQRTDNFDGSNFNILEIEMIQGINLLPKTCFPDLLSPYFCGSKSVLHGRKKKMIRIYWHMLDSIGGIPVMDHFEVNLFPLSIKLEHEVGKKIFDYVFPGRGVVNFIAQEKSSPLKKDINADISSTENYYKTDISRPFYSSRSSSFSLLMNSIKSPIESFSCLSKLSRESIKSNSSFQIFYDSEDPYGIESLKLSKSETQITDSNAFEKNSRISNKPYYKPNDDLNQMVLRANNNMTLLYVKVPSLILCLSYKGPRKKNIEDLNNFVFCIPTIEYRNKTWSYLDLVLHIKKEIIKAIIGHTGSLVKDKFIQRRSREKLSQIKREYIPFKINMPLNYKNKNTELQKMSSNIIKSNLTKINCLHSNHKHHLHNFSERSLSCVSHLVEYNDTEESEESRVKKAKMLLGKFIDPTV